ncbi:MAG TPA: MerR family transcriptional regulator, partial [Gemmatimonadaceae bacterium]|nr:MerR family transcriptional regulator [Gemmatimonadaceae bacterium]
LRFWESEFPQLAPEKHKNGQRVYRRQDIDLILKIKKLLYEDEYTIADVRKRIEAELAGLPVQPPEKHVHAPEPPPRPVTAGDRMLPLESLLPDDGTPEPEPSWPVPETPEPARESPAELATLKAALDREHKARQEAERARDAALERERDAVREAGREREGRLAVERERDLAIANAASNAQEAERERSLREAAERARDAALSRIDLAASRIRGAMERLDTPSS